MVGALIIGFVVLVVLAGARGAASDRAAQRKAAHGHHSRHHQSKPMEALPPAMRIEAPPAAQQPNPASEMGGPQRFVYPEPEMIVVHRTKPAVLVDNLRLDLLLHYEDARWNVTDRLVTIQQAIGNPRTGHIAEFRGFCHTRKAVRTFRAPGILYAADPETGEVIRDVQGFVMRRAQAR